MAVRRPITCIVPPHLLLRVIREGDDAEREAALRTLAVDESFRLARAQLAALQRPAASRVAIVGGLGGQPHRTIFDQENSEAIALGRVVRSEGDPAVDDPAVNEAYDGFGATYSFFWDVFGRDSLDDEGHPLLGLVHYGRDYGNAFWDGQGHMFFGDGDGQLFLRLTRSLDVIGHELVHGITQFEANLAYANQAGALNESVSDVFGSLVKQYHLGQQASEADWLIGTEIVGPLLEPALRSLKQPGTANRFDDQPADMDHFVRTAEDSGGVHINSGIPNRAFFVVATTLGGCAWERAGTIWYDALKDPQVRPNLGFAAFARITLRQAQIRFGPGSEEADAVTAGWEAVKLRF